jgi:hypothetical protein
MFDNFSKANMVSFIIIDKALCHLYDFIFNFIIGTMEGKCFQHGMETMIMLCC